MLPIQVALQITLQQKQQLLGRLAARVNHHQQAGDQRGVNLQRHAVLRFGKQVPAFYDAFEPAEKDLDLPAVMVQRHDLAGVQVEAVGEQNQFVFDWRFRRSGVFSALVFGIQIARGFDTPGGMDHAQFQRLFRVRTVFGEDDTFVGDDAGRFRRAAERPRFERRVNRAAFDPRDQGALRAEDGAPDGARGIAAIDDVNRAGFDLQREDMALIGFAVTEFDVDGHVVEDVENHVRLERRFGGPVERLPEKRVSHARKQFPERGVGGENFQLGWKPLRTPRPVQCVSVAGEFQNHFAQRLGIEDAGSLGKAAQRGAMQAEVADMFVFRQRDQLAQSGDGGVEISQQQQDEMIVEKMTAIGMRLEAPEFVKEALQRLKELEPLKLRGKFGIAFHAHSIAWKNEGLIKEK